MPKASKDILDTIQDQMKARLAELQPQVDEYHSIEMALKRMNPRRGRLRPGKPGLFFVYRQTKPFMLIPGFQDEGIFHQYPSSSLDHQIPSRNRK
jgi:hypothetical protein